MTCECMCELNGGVGCVVVLVAALPLPASAPFVALSPQGEEIKTRLRND